MFLNHLYGGMDEPELKIIDVFICKLRKKLQALPAVSTISRRCGGAATYCAIGRRTSPPRTRTLSPDCILLSGSLSGSFSLSKQPLLAAPGERLLPAAGSRGETSGGQSTAAMVNAGRTAVTGRLKNGKGCDDRDR
jgi:hypothetical protein